MKLNLKALATLALSSLAINAFAADKLEVLTVAANPTPHAEILNFVKPYLKEHGVDLQVKEFSDYVLPNTVVQEGQVDANYFQHLPYLTAFNKEHGTKIVPGLNVHVEPFGFYSTKVKNVNDLKDGAVVAIPNDTSNLARSLLLLSTTGLVKLKDPKNIFATTRDIVENPKHLKFREVEAATLPRVLPDVDLAAVNANYALTAGLNPVKDALVLEGAQSPYANFISFLPGKENDPRIVKLYEALQRQEVKDYILNKYNGAVVPVFEVKDAPKAEKAEEKPAQK